MNENQKLRDAAIASFPLWKFNHGRQAREFQRFLDSGAGPYCAMDAVLEVASLEACAAGTWRAAGRFGALARKAAAEIAAVYIQSTFGGTL